MLCKANSLPPSWSLPATASCSRKRTFRRVLALLRHVRVSAILRQRCSRWAVRGPSSSGSRSAPRRSDARAAPPRPSPGMRELRPAEELGGVRVELCEHLWSVGSLRASRTLSSAEVRARGLMPSPCPAAAAAARSRAARPPLHLTHLTQLRRRLRRNGGGGGGVGGGGIGGGGSVGGGGVGGGGVGGVGGGGGGGGGGGAGAGAGGVGGGGGGAGGGGVALDLVAQQVAGGRARAPGTPSCSRKRGCGSSGLRAHGRSGRRPRPAAAPRAAARAAGSSRAPPPLRRRARGGSLRPNRARRVDGDPAELQPAVAEHLERAPILHPRAAGRELPAAWTRAAAAGAALLSLSCEDAGNALSTTQRARRCQRRGRRCRHQVPETTSARAPRAAWADPPLFERRHRAAPHADRVDKIIDRQRPRVAPPLRG